MSARIRVVDASQETWVHRARVDLPNDWKPGEEFARRSRRDGLVPRPFGCVGNSAAVLEWATWVPTSGEPAVWMADT